MVEQGEMRGVGVVSGRQVATVATGLGVKSEQAMVHSAPSPCNLLFDWNCRISLFAPDVKLLGPVL